MTPPSRAVASSPPPPGSPPPNAPPSGPGFDPDIPPVGTVTSGFRAIPATGFRGQLDNVAQVPTSQTPEVLEFAERVGFPSNRYGATDVQEIIQDLRHSQNTNIAQKAAGNRLGPGFDAEDVFENLSLTGTKDSPGLVTQLRNIDPQAPPPSTGRTRLRERFTGPPARGAGVQESEATMHALLTLQNLAKARRFDMGAVAIRGALGGATGRGASEFLNLSPGASTATGIGMFGAFTPSVMSQLTFRNAGRFGRTALRPLAAASTSPPDRER